VSPPGALPQVVSGQHVHRGAEASLWLSTAILPFRCHFPRPPLTWHAVEASKPLSMPTVLPAKNREAGGKFRQQLSVHRGFAPSCNRPPVVAAQGLVYGEYLTLKDETPPRAPLPIALHPQSLFSNEALMVCRDLNSTSRRAGVSATSLGPGRRGLETAVRDAAFPSGPWNSNVITRWCVAPPRRGRPTVASSLGC
jgi:hypothetical protein